MGKLCGICGSQGNHIQYNVREMMFGSRNQFPYFLCSDCGCLQLEEAPKNLSSHYPSNYYSFSENTQVKKGLSRWLYGKWILYLVTHDSFIGKIMAAMKRKKVALYEFYRAAGMNPKQKILDIGSGNGSALFPLKEAGFDHLIGSDEFINGDILFDNNLLIRKANLFDITETNWDLIMFNHSFEHLPQQKEHLLQVHKLLKQGGTCLIRIPTVSSYAWEHYQENWVQLDSPRHFFLHSHKSISLLANQTGFEVKKIIHESNSFQFTGSEQYLLNIPIFGDPASYFEGNTNLFTSEQLKDFEKRTEQLNQQNRADSIGIVLTKY